MPEIRPLRCFSSSHKVLRLCGSPVFLGRLFLGKLLFRLLIYFKSKNAKKFRRDAEYGSARWSA